MLSSKMPVATENAAATSEVALNMQSFSLDSTLGQIEKKIDPNVVAKVKATLKER